MPATLLQNLASAYRAAQIEHPQLRAVSLAQWMLESGRASSKLATEHLNFGGLKWRSEMTPFATRVTFTAHDGEDDYCKFASIDKFIAGYWAFLERTPYTGWKQHAASGESFIRFIGPIYTPSAGYAEKVLKLVAEADALLGAAGAPGASPGAPTALADLGAIVIDPGHGGTQNVPGSSANNATSVSGVREKDLTLRFCRVLRDELVQQSQNAGERIKVVMTRDSDINLTGSARAGHASANGAKLFLCLHFNGLTNATVRGSETFFRAQENGNLNLADDMAFARDVHAGLMAGMRAIDPNARDRGVKPDNQTGPGALGVLNDAALGNSVGGRACRAAYIEAEFITHPDVDRLLISGPQAQANVRTVMGHVATAIRKHMKAMA